MRVSVWIVTYQNAEDLRANLDSLFAHVDPSLTQLDVNVINNHTTYELPKIHWAHVKTWHNVLRSNLSLGHLSRNWNQALVQGFGNLNSPQTDVVMCCQDDVLWHKDWSQELHKAMQTHTLITQGVGDAVIAYKPEAVKRIGLWDERFTPSFYHDGDYLLRALMYNKEFSSINDPAHGRIFNPWPTTWASVPSANGARVQAKNLSYGKARVPHQVWQHKWKVSPIHWTPDMIAEPPARSECKNFITYPHFEMDVYDLEDKNYLI